MKLMVCAGRLLIPEIRTFPVCFSTVTPGKFPVFWFSPVSALNNVDFPLFGLPTSATLRVDEEASDIFGLNDNCFGFGLADTDDRTVTGKSKRIAERSFANHCN